DIKARECVRESELLYPEWLVDGTSGERGHDRRGHAELAERLLGHLVRLLFGFETPCSKHPKEEREAHLTGSPGWQPVPHTVAVGSPGSGYAAAIVPDEKPERLTRAEKEQLEAELAELEGPRRTAMVEAIADARGFGDLSENR